MNRLQRFFITLLGLTVQEDDRLLRLEGLVKRIAMTIDEVNQKAADLQTALDNITKAVAVVDADVKTLKAGVPDLTVVAGALDAAATTVQAQGDALNAIHVEATADAAPPVADTPPA